MKYSTIPGFDRDLKKLLKRFSSLTEDLEVAKKNAIEVFHVLHIDNGSVYKIPDFCCEGFEMYKITKFACRSLKGRGVRSGVRIIYAYFPTQKAVEMIEMYYKGDKDNMDYERAKAFLRVNSENQRS